MNVLQQLSNTKLQNATFPNFLPFSKEFFVDYQNFIHEFPQHCDFTLNNMLIWFAGESSLSFSWLNGNVILKVSDTIYESGFGENIWYTVIGNSNADKTLRELFASGITGLQMVPDYFVASIAEPLSFTISEDLNNRDYILNIEQLLQRNGKEYQNFRYQISYFLKKYSENAVLKELDLTSIHATKEVINALHTWPRVASFQEGGNDPGKIDALAIDRLFRLQSILPIKHQCLGLYINDKLEGFSIYHIPYAKDTIALGNHIKTNGEFNRLFDFLVFATANRLKAQGVTLLNAEQDMGLDGLRHHKSFLNPFTFYRKYSVLPK